MKFFHTFFGLRCLENEFKKLLLDLIKLVLKALFFSQLQNYNPKQYLLLIHPAISTDLKNILEKKWKDVVQSQQTFFTMTKKFLRIKIYRIFSAKQAEVVYIVRKIIFGRQKTIPITFPSFFHPSRNVFSLLFSHFKTLCFSLSCLQLLTHLFYF